MIEASQDIYYGSQGDYYTVATNPLRDTVFMGNQRAYDIFGTVCMISSSVLSLGAGALSSGLAAVNANTSVAQALGVYGAKTAVTFAAAAGGGVAGHEIALGLGASETVADITGLLSGTAVGMAAGFGANAVDKHFNLSGYHNINTQMSQPNDSFPKDRAELNRQLLERGYKCVGTTEGGYVEYRHPETGAKVWIRPNGEVITVVKEWLPDGSRKISVRYNWDGTPVENLGHNTGEFVEIIDESTFLPPPK